jgi:hypothetical protein
MTSHQVFKVQAFGHIAASKLRVGSAPNVPADLTETSVHLESSPERNVLRSAAFMPLPRRQPADQSFRSLPFER